MRTEYDPTMTMSEARDRYFAINGFGPEGGYNDAWVDYKLGPIPAPVPNTAGRKRAVPFHDLHHVLTGYDTNTIGEFEISAWEIAAGCRDVAAAWALNLSGLAGGAIMAPRRVWRAFLRGRRMDTLYGRNLDELLGRTVAEVRALVTHDEPPTRARPGDIALFALAVAAGFLVGSVLFGGMVLILPLSLSAYLLRRRAAAA